MKTAGKRSSRAAASVLQAAEFKAEALAVMRRVSETGQPVTITSRGKALVRIEPIREERRAAGYGSMRGTVEFLLCTRNGGALRNRPARAASGRDAVERRHGGCARPAAGDGLRPCHDHRGRPRQHGAIEISRSGVADFFVRPRFAGQDGFRETIFAGPRHGDNAPPRSREDRT